jgi:deazaflavin-dependent oxidoreductase (nitroreductase family)
VPVRIPPADPANQKSPIVRRLMQAGVSKPGTWYVKNVSPRIDPILARATKGRVSSIPVLPILLLHHVGAKSGQARVTPLVYFTQGDEVVVMASNYGGKKHPAWFHNVKANPEVTLQSRGREGRYRARVPEGEERERLWELAKRHSIAYSRYESITDRTIPVVMLSPLDAD